MGMTDIVWIAVFAGLLMAGITLTHWEYLGWYCRAVSIVLSVLFLAYAVGYFCFQLFRS